MVRACVQYSCVGDTMADDEPVEVSEIAGCIISVKKNGDVHLECNSDVSSIDISRDDIKTLDGISDMAVEENSE